MRLPVPSSFLILSPIITTVIAFPAHASLAGLSREALEAIIPTLEIRAPPEPPAPLKDTSAKLVNDAAHPWKPLAPADIRGPCPGLNTLASHGVRTASCCSTSVILNVTSKPPVIKHLLILVLILIFFLPCRSGFLVMV